jgi:hypothetical protein
MSNLGAGMPSLAQATSTLLDSACKHIQQCRVSQDHMTKFLKNSHDQDELIRNKYRYCVHKDELVLGVGRSWAKDGSDKKFQNNAYPRVVSNLGGMADMVGTEDSPEVKLMKVMYHNATSIPERNGILTKFQNALPADFPPVPAAVMELAGQAYLGAAGGDGTMTFAPHVHRIHDFITVGYANTLGWAHAHCGDTMTSVMIGGLRTVMNGDFDVFTGDLIQWYWPFERNCFMKNGRRKKRLMDNTAAPPFPVLQADPGQISADGSANTNWNLDRDGQLRKQFFDQQYGERRPDDKKMVALIKPYKRDDDAPRIYDWYRVFAVALCSARPREKVDIRISRQAL